MQKLIITGREKKYSFITSCFLIFSALFFYGCNKNAQTTGLQDPVIENLVGQATEILRSGLADEDRRIRVNAIEVVASEKRMELMPKVEELLKDDYVPVRFAAALAVGDTEYQLGKKTLEKLLKDNDQNCRIAAAYALY